MNLIYKYTHSPNQFCALNMTNKKRYNHSLHVNSASDISCAVAPINKQRISCLRGNDGSAIYGAAIEARVSRVWLDDIFSRVIGAKRL